MKNMSLEYFTCAICHIVVNEPVECRLCQQLFCSACLIDYLNNTQDSCCPSGCVEPVFERVGHAFDKLMSFFYVKCKNLGCNYEDCIKFLHKHEQVCKHRHEKMEVDHSEEIIMQRDMFWLQLLNRIMTPVQASCNFSASPSPFQQYSINSMVTQNSCTPGSFLSMTPKVPQNFKF